MNEKMNERREFISMRKVDAARGAREAEVAAERVWVLMEQGPVEDRPQRVLGVRKHAVRGPHGAAESAAFARTFDIPAGARLACARVDLACAMKANGMLASFLPRINAHVHNDVCVRGTHIFSKWRISDNPLIESFDITQDLEVGRDSANVTVRVHGTAPFPLSILTPTIYAHADEMTRIASVNFVTAICEADLRRG
jgi:hypothetical protein